jgi:hypothetical protein
VSLDDPPTLQILTTEHWGLLSARSLVYNEAFARAGMFLTFLSASLVALALAAQGLGFGPAFLALAAVIFGVDIILGLATIVRIMDATIDDLRAIHGMNRIRAGYARIAPNALPFLVTSIHDDAPGVFSTYGSRGVLSGREAFMHSLSTTGGMIGAIVALLTGGLAGVVALLAGLPVPATGVLAVGAAGAAQLGLAQRSRRAVRRYQDSIDSRFPSQPDGPEGRP